MTAFAGRHTGGVTGDAIRMTSRLLLLTDRSQLPLGRSLLSNLRECAAAGATHVVVRELDLPESQRAALVAEVAALPGVTAYSAHTLLPGAAGVHLPAAEFQGLPARQDGVAVPATPRDQRGFGRSCHSAEEVRRAAAAGAAYATLSPYAASTSKPGYGPAVPPEAYAGHDIPVYALAGVTPHNAAEARHAGAYGVAVMGAVMRAPDPAATVAALLEAIR